MIPSIDPKPPGRKLIKRMSTRTKWMILAPCGLLMFSFGLTVLSEAAHQRRTGVPNTGLILFGEALRFRILLNVRRETRRSMRQIVRKVNTKSNRKTKSDKKAKSPTKTD